MTRLTALLFLIPLYVLGQDENEKDILLVTEKENGVYQTFKEFRTNSPSIKGTLKITNHRIKILNERTGKFESIKESFWGACVNDTIYVYLKDIQTVESPHIYSLDFLGRYCYFSDYRISKTYASMSGSTGTWASIEDKIEYIININNGLIYKIDKQLMRQILSKDSDLLNKFENENNKRQVFREYIEILNSRRLEDIKPIDSL